MAAVSAIEEGSGVKEGSPGEDAIGLGVHQSRFNGGDIHFFIFYFNFNFFPQGMGIQFSFAGGKKDGGKKGN